MTRQAHGFTVIELVFVIFLTSIASILFFVQKNNLEVTANDNMKKTAINAMYYGLEEVYYPSHKYYPQTISSDVLKSVDPILFTDPDGIKINASGSAYSYSPLNCTDGKCKSYTLKAILQNEGDYTKSSNNN